jgi:rare lipoprotein A
MKEILRRISASGLKPLIHKKTPFVKKILSKFPHIPPFFSGPGLFGSLFRSLILAGVVFSLVFTGSPSTAQTKKIPATQRPYVINSKTYYPIPTAEGYTKEGIASWYGPGFHGRKTSNGEVYNMYEMTAAHKLLPMNTMLLVHNLENDRKVVVRVNDRGPFVRDRIIDLSHTAAKALGILKKGTMRVEIVALANKFRKKKDGSAVLSYDDIQHGDYFVQIGAFRYRSNAKALAKRFHDAGHNTMIYRWQGEKQELFRLWVYVGHTLNRAEDAERRLQNKGYDGAFIVRYDKEQKQPLSAAPRRLLSDSPRVR